MKNTLIVVPMKEPSLAKTRLADTLDAIARAKLARFLYRRTLAVLGPIANQTGSDLAVVTKSQDARGIAQDANCAVIDEGSGKSSLSAAASLAAQWAERRGYGRLCLIPADLIAPDPADLRALLASVADVVICPSQDHGTNALLVSPPTAIGFHYGPHSAERHHAEALGKGLNAVFRDFESLSFDIDTSTCLERAVRIAPDLRAVG